MTTKQPRTRRAAPTRAPESGARAPAGPAASDMAFQGEGLGGGGSVLCREPDGEPVAGGLDRGQQPPRCGSYPWTPGPVTA